MYLLWLFSLDKSQGLGKSHKYDTVQKEMQNKNQLEHSSNWMKNNLEV